MSDDLVTRLKSYAGSTTSPTMAALLREAAERIEALEGQISEAKEDAWWTGYHDGKQAEQDRDKDI